MKAMLKDRKDIKKVSETSHYTPVLVILLSGACISSFIFIFRDRLLVLYRFQLNLKMSPGVINKVHISNLTFYFTTVHFFMFEIHF